MNDINHKELRIGNLVKNGLNQRIEPLDWLYQCPMQGVPITDKRLRQAGFSRVEPGHENHIGRIKLPYYLNNSIILYFNSQRGVEGELPVMASIGYSQIDTNGKGAYHVFPGRWIHYMHELQNFYHAVTGKELDLGKDMVFKKRKKAHVDFGKRLDIVAKPAPANGTKINPLVNDELGMLGPETRLSDIICDEMGQIKPDQEETPEHLYHAGMKDAHADALADIRKFLKELQEWADKYHRKTAPHTGKFSERTSSGPELRDRLNRYRTGTIDISAHGYAFMDGLNTPRVSHEDQLPNRVTYFVGLPSVGLTNVPFNNAVGIKGKNGIMYFNFDSKGCRIEYGRRVTRWIPLRESRLISEILAIHCDYTVRWEYTRQHRDVFDDAEVGWGGE